MTAIESIPRLAEDLLCGHESPADVEYAEFQEAEQGVDRRLDFSGNEWFHQPEPKR